MSSFSQSDYCQKLVSAARTIMDAPGEYKLDFIARVFINGSQFFNVFRRYNSVYEIVVADMQGELYYRKNSSIRVTLQDIMCMNDDVADHIYTDRLFSYKHNADMSDSMPHEVADLLWTDVQSMYEAIQVDFKGVMEGYYVPSTPLYSTPTATTALSTNEVNAAATLSHLHIPQVENAFELRECDMPVSQTATSRKRARNYCYCEYEGYSHNSTQSDDESDYIILRNGTMIPKRRNQ